MLYALSISLLLQSVVVSPPPTTAPMRADVYANHLRQKCMSEAGIAIATADWEEGQRVNQVRLPESRRIDQELGEAAYATPIDIDRLGRAVQARDAYQAERLADLRRRSIATLRRLGPADRAIFASGMSIYRPDRPARVCSGNTR